MFNYQRKEIEKFEVQNSLKNGTREEKREVLQRLENEKALERSLALEPQKSNGIEL